MEKERDALRQELMRKYYDNSDYYMHARDNFADKETKFNRYTIKNALSIYYPKRGEKILDIGCGWGNISLALQKKGFAVIGLDYSKKSIEICRNTAKKLGLNPSRFICRDATRSKLGPESFDVVYCCDFVEHIYPHVYEELLDEIHRILKQKGKLVIYTPNPSHFLERMREHKLLLKKEVSHVDYKTMKRLKESLTKHGFFIIRAYYIESHLPIVAHIERMLKNSIPLFRRRNAVFAIKV